MLKSLGVSIISFLISYKSQIICVLIGIFIKEIWSFFKSKLGDTKQFLIKEYRWQPNTPLCNPNADQDINECSSYDIRMNFENDTLDFDDLVKGEECLIQHLIVYINTPKNDTPIYTYHDFGNEFAKTIFTETSVIEFQRQCEKMAQDILKSEYYEDYIEKIYCIYRKKSDLYIEMKLCGNPKTVTCKVPNKCKS